MEQVRRKFLNTNDVAKLTGFTVAWVRNKARTGQIPCYDLGQYRYDQEEIENWIQERKQPCRNTKGARSGGTKSLSIVRQSASRLDHLLKLKPKDRKQNIGKD